MDFDLERNKGKQKNVTRLAPLLPFLTVSHLQPRICEAPSHRSNRHLIKRMFPRAVFKIYTRLYLSSLPLMGQFIMLFKHSIPLMPVSCWNILVLLVHICVILISAMNVSGVSLLAHRTHICLVSVDATKQCSESLCQLTLVSAMKGGSDYFISSLIFAVIGLTLV